MQPIVVRLAHGSFHYPRDAINNYRPKEPALGNEMPSQPFVSPDDIRVAFSQAMSDMYRKEVPLYGDLLEIVADTNAAALANGVSSGVIGGDDLARLNGERHGAIRLGTAEELRGVKRAFAVMGMRAVGYYDLTVAGVPVHSTAFRPVTEEALSHNPFRVFTSLLRLDLVEDINLRDQAAAILSRRRILNEQAMTMIERAEAQGGLAAEDAKIFVVEVLQTFRWHSEAVVDAQTYRRLHDAHRLIADVVSFKGPHINHLTPRTLDIDAVQTEMPRRGIAAKALIEGPPRREVPILLRQTSFTALQEKIIFSGQDAREAGTHTARFGEVEQRGLALKPKGRLLYDALIEEARDGKGGEYSERLADVFVKFPDDPGILRREGLGYFRYYLTPSGERVAREGTVSVFELDDLIDAGWVSAIPITYEDFLPVSAAGIFQSNLGDEKQQGYAAGAAQSAFELALGDAVLDPFELYRDIEERSLRELGDALGHTIALREMA
jgi:uncharacterized glyoxalase superfamily metalloenzyme YdcJ